jgi:hypothetical protein
MGKAKGDHTPDPLPLDDPRWMPMLTAHHLVSEQLTGVRLSWRASDDVVEKLQSGKLRCMRLTTAKPIKRELVEASFWNDHEIVVDFGFVQIYRGPPGPIVRDPHTRINGWEFYIWKPDLEQLWFATAPPPSSPDEPIGHGTKVKRCKEVLRIVYPDGVPTDITHKDFVDLDLVKSTYKKNGWPLPERDVFSRATGRRK